MLVKKIYGLFDREERISDRDTFFVSEVDKCPIAIFYSFKKKPKGKLGPQAHLRFSDGDDTHRRLVRALFSLGIVRAIEIPIPEGQLFSGRADAVVCIGGKLYVVEIKAVGSNKFKFMSKPDPAHVKQLQFYLYYLNIDAGIILIENKDTQELKEFIIKRDIKLVNRITTFFKILMMNIVQNEVPRKPEDLAEWKCRYCPYQEICDKKVREQLR